MLDWRNPEDYAYAASLTHRQWAWEFLRRGSRYRKLFSALDDFSRREFDGKQQGDEVLMPDGLFDLATQLGLAGHLPGPDVRADRVKDLGWSGGVRVIYPGQRLNHQPQIVALAFNALLPIEPQLRFAEEIVRETRQKLEEFGHSIRKTPPVRTLKDAWTIYLRLLDARAAGVSIAEMGRVVYPGAGDPRKSAQNALRRAEAFAETEYLQLLTKEDRR
jgi:transcriptional regulator